MFRPEPPVLRLTLPGKARRDRCSKRSIRFSPPIQAQFLTPAVPGFSARWRNAIQRQQSGPWWRWATIRFWGDNAVILSRSFGEGLLARMMKDEARANAAFSRARLEQEKIVQAQPGYGPAFCVLGLIDAALGRKKEALSEGRRAIELLPVEKDSTVAVRCLSISP